MAANLSSRVRLGLGCATVAGAVLAWAAAASGTTAGSAVRQIPGGIPSNCSVDVTGPILAWVASVPDGSVLSFPKNGCYRIEGTLEISGRRGLRFEGHGSTFRSFRPPANHRALWRISDSRNITLDDMTIDGSYARGGTFTAGLQHAHAVDVSGSSVDLGDLTMTDIAGDCVYFGPGFASRTTRSAGTLHDSTCLRTSRNAVAVVAGDDIRVLRVRTGAIGYDVFDVEPNLDGISGSNRVTFDHNTIGSYAENVYSIVENAPIAHQSFTNNRVVGAGLKVAITHHPSVAGFRAREVTIAGNTSDTPQAPSAINVDHVDGLVIRGNTVPMTGGPMAAVVDSCRVTVAGNRYPGGSAEALIYPSTCS